MSKTRFTLRLDESEYQELATIKKLTGTSTNTQAIRFIISHYAELNDRYVSAINKTVKLNEKYKEQDRCVDDLLQSLEKLKVLNRLKPVKHDKKK